MIGAFGLAIDIDERHREIEERNRLLEIERRQRERMEYLAKVNDVLGLLVRRGRDRAARHGVGDPRAGASGARSSYRIDRRPRPPVDHRCAQRSRQGRGGPSRSRRDHPYDPDAPWGAAQVIRSGRREVIPSVDPAVFSLPGGDVLREIGLQSVITVPVIGALGTLGAMQLIRCDGQPTVRSGRDRSHR